MGSSISENLTRAQAKSHLDISKSSRISATKILRLFVVIANFSQDYSSYLSSFILGSRRLKTSSISA